MSERIQVSYQGRNVSVSKPANSLVQSVLEEACAALQVCDPLSHRLVLERGEKAIDHSLSIRQANLKSPAKLALVKAPPTRSQMVVVTLLHKERSFTATVHTNTSLFALLQRIEQQHSSSSSSGGGAEEKLQWTDWHGIPEPEVNAQFEVHIHVPGYMQPCVEIGPRKINTNEELKRITLFNLGLHSDSSAPAKVRMKLSHSYTPPQRTEEEKQAVIDNFQRRYQEMMQSMGQGAASAASTAAASAPQSLAHAHAARITIEEEEDVDVASEEEEEEAEAAPFTLPPDRRIQLLHAQPGMLKAPELPDEFYEVTEEDALEYAKSIRREALRSGALRAGDKMPTDLPLNEEKSGAASSSSPLLDSSRLPAVPPSHSRRVARAKRKCKATLLRIRLPNHLYAEGLFKTDETPADVYHWLDSLLLSEEGVKLKDKYYLYITPPRQQLSRTSKLTLMQLGLIPQALVHYGEPTQRNMTQGVGAFVLPEESKEEKEQKERVPGSGLLKPEWLERVQHVLPPTPTTTTAADEASAAEVTEKKEETETSAKDSPATGAGGPADAAATST